jgi:Domain of unknown function (DUF4395)
VATPTISTGTRTDRPQVDVRGPRFGAWVTTVVLAVVLVTGWWPLLAAQAVVFWVGALAGLRWAPYGLVFRHLVAPRLGPVTEREDAAPPRFAQAVGGVFAVVGVVGFVTGVAPLGLVATGLALVAALLNAAVGLCLGCEMYLLLRRVRLSNN